MPNLEKDKPVPGKIALDKFKVLFKPCFARNLSVGYSIKDLKGNQIKEFQSFIDKTVGAGLTITEVDKRYLRGKDKQKVNVIDGCDELHYGEEHKAFRLFGIYNIDGYFVITKIDGGHKKHRMK